MKLVTPRRFGDARGYFVESWNRRAYKTAGIDIDFCQDNQSLSAPVGTVRGLHFQTPPNAQAKLVGVLNLQCDGVRSRGSRAAHLAAGRPVRDSYNFV